jgi:hypothetical protein
MPSDTTKPEAVQPEAAARLFEDWFDPIESGLRERVRGFIEEMIRAELDAVLARPRYARQHTGAEHASGPARPSARQPHAHPDGDLRAN